MSETKIPTEVPLPLLEAHAGLAAACDDWQDTWTVKASSPDDPPMPVLRKDTSTEFVCYVAQQPHVAIDEIQGAALSVMLPAFILGLLISFAVGIVVTPWFLRSKGRPGRWLDGWLHRRTPT